MDTPVSPGQGTWHQRLRSDFATSFLHWIIVALFLVNLVTGLRIAGDSTLATWSRALSGILPQGNVYILHLWSAWALGAACAGYVAFLLFARLGPRVALDSSRFRALRSHDRRTRWQSINVLIYWIAFVLVGGAVVSGSLLYFNVMALPQQSLTTLHRVLAWSLLGYVLLHIGAQWAMTGWRGLLKIITPRLAYMAAAGIGLVAAGTLAAGIFAVDQATLPALVLEKTDTPPRLDGDAGDAVWQTAVVASVDTHNGQNLPQGSVPVLVRGVHDGENAYLLFEWPDRTRSQKHLPLQKTAEGWRVMQSQYGRQDENDFYEDKFAVMLSRDSQLAALNTSNLGPKPLAGKPGGPNGRGLHYTTDGSVVDVWHWKSVRTGPLGQIDDNFFGPPLAPPENPAARYTAGYDKDPKSAGGFTMNWEKFDGGIVKPRWLPRSPEILAERIGSFDSDPQVGDQGLWWLPRDLVEPASAELDARFPVGTVMPSVIAEAPFEGDRGDVSAVAEWTDGWWRMEVKRKLDTASEYDVAIADGTYLWVSVFDHTQTRHSFHLRPLQIRIP
ncbi:MAG: ethylbenzene dehydrogenase-related protein [Kiloniellaceae bacterium]